MKVVVVGGTGNISLSIVRLLLENGHDVTCFNRGNNRRDLPGDVRIITGDRRDREAFEKAMQAEKFDAAIDMVSFSVEDATSSIAAFREVGQFIQCSTSCTYGIKFDWQPVPEDHPVHPITAYGIGKAAADRLLMEAYEKENFPVTIIKPSTTYGSQIGLLRQIDWEYSWLDRIRKGKPILVCDGGKALHQFLHVDDAAKGFAGAIGKQHCIGQTYNLVRMGCTNWATHHKTAMKVLGKEVELVSAPLRLLMAYSSPAAAETSDGGMTPASRFSFCKEISSHDCYYDAEKTYRDIPEFRPSVSLEAGMTQVIEYMDATGMIPDSDGLIWEDEIIAAVESGLRANVYNNYHFAINNDTNEK